ncbi:MAG: hypothetical protein JNM93_12150 [Bacteriovoracaceae bacterium]|nr:hypothetical protein [Bacteriovoracaceae bacterium]
MPKFKGLDEAAKIVQNLTGKHQEKLLSDISKQNPKLAELIKNRLVVFEDLRYLTPEMMRVVLKKFQADELGLALRVASKELIAHIRSLVSSNNQKEIDAVLSGKPKSVTKVQEMQAKIMEYVREKIKTGEIVIDKNSSETYV